jgi:drug/metabolite transporter (DMT)-like permease
VGVGELCNFAAYGFVPATLVTPLGALSVLISAILSAYFLDEKLNKIGKIGCVLTAIGSTVMVIHAPKEGDVKSVHDLLGKIQETEFIIFTILSILGLFALIFVFAPRYGSKNILVYILICSILGSFTVMSCKGLSLGIKEIVSKSPSVSYLYTYLFGIILIVCIMVQMNYLNKALDLFNTAIVTTVYYVLFTLFVMISSSVLFKELLNLSFEDFVGCLCGFSTIVCALCLIHFFKTSNDSDMIHLANTQNSAANSNNSPLNEFYTKDLSVDDDFVNSSFNNSTSPSSKNGSSNSENNINFRDRQSGENHKSGGGGYNGGSNLAYSNNGFSQLASKPQATLSLQNEQPRVMMKSTTITGADDLSSSAKSSFIKPSAIFKKLASGNYNDIYKSFPIANNLFKPSYKLLENNDDMDDITNEDEVVIHSSYPKMNYSNKRKLRPNGLHDKTNDQFLASKMSRSGNQASDVYSKIVSYKNVTRNNRYLSVNNKNSAHLVDQNSLYNDESDENPNDETSLSGSSLITLRS